MPYLPADLATPIPTLDNQAWWDACKRRELVFQRCAACGVLRHPPGPACLSCQSFEHDWLRSSGRGRVFSFTWVHHVYAASLKEHVPYNVTIVTLDDAPGVRLVTNVVEIEPAELAIGVTVEVVWQEAGDFVLPRFRRV